MNIDLLQLAMALADATSDTSGGFWDTITKLLNSQSSIIIIATACATILSRLAIKIFNMGRMYKTTVLSREEFVEYKKEAVTLRKQDKADTQNTLMTVLTEMISMKLEPLKEANKNAAQITIYKAQLEAKTKQIDSNTDRIAVLERENAKLNERIERLESGGVPSEGRRKADL